MKDDPCAHYSWKGHTGVAMIRPGGMMYVSATGVLRVVTYCDPDLSDDEMFVIGERIFREIVSPDLRQGPPEVI